MSRHSIQSLFFYKKEFLRKMSTLSGWTNMSYYTLPQIYDNALAKVN